MSRDRGRYTRIKSRFWIDEKSGRWSNDLKLLALYLLSCPHGNMLGCFVLPKLYICADLGWDADKLEPLFSTLIKEGFIAYDDSTNVIFVKKHLKHNPIENSNQAQAAIKVVNELPRTHLLSQVAQVIRENGKQFLEPLVQEIEELLAKPFPEPLDKPLGEQNGNPVTVTVTVTEDNRSSSSKVFDEDSIQMSLARRLRTRILENLPNARVPKNTPEALKSWCDEIDRMIRIDKREPQEIAEIIDWAQSNDFWRANILSAKKLRAQFDRLTLQKQRGEKNRQRPATKNPSEDDDWLIQK